MNILLVDDHTLYRNGLAQLVQGILPNAKLIEAFSYQNAIEVIQKQTFELALIDLRLPDGSGIDLLSQLVHVDPLLPVIIISGVDDYPVIQQVFEQGASGFLPKHASNEVMIKAINHVLAGNIYSPFDDDFVLPNAQHNLPATLAAQLTPKQIEVLALLAKGLSNKVIARQLGITDITVKAHLSSIFSTLNVRNRNEAIVRILELRYLM